MILQASILSLSLLTIPPLTPVIPAASTPTTPVTPASSRQIDRATPQAAPVPSPVLSTLASAPSAPTRLTSERDDRELALNRPSRSGRAALSVVLRAASFPPSIRGRAACVIGRESGGNLERRQSGVAARNSGSSAQGRWQFINNDWQHSLPWMVRDRLIRFGMSKAQARQVRAFLDQREIATWHGYWQDIGFLEVIERGGYSHWNGPGCSR